MVVNKLEDCEAQKNAFELNGETEMSENHNAFHQVQLSTHLVCLSSGALFERLHVVCNNQQDLQDWVEHLSRQIKHTTATAPSHKPISVPCHTVSSRHKSNKVS